MKKDIEQTVILNNDDSDGFLDLNSRFELKLVIDALRRSHEK